MTSTAFANLSTTALSPTTVPFLVNDGRKKPAVFYTIRIVIWLTTSVVAILGNSMVLTVSVVNRKTIGLCRSLIAHLALCDLIYGVFQIAAAVARLKMSDAWLDITGCKIVETVLFGSTTLSCWTIVAIAIERYRGIVQPLQRQWGKRQLRIVIAVLWIATTVSVAPLFVVSNYHHASERCYEEWGIQEGRRYAIFLFVIHVALPLVLLIFLYCRIIRTVLKPSLLECAQDNCTIQRDFAERRRREERRIVCLLLIMVGLYFVLITPDNLVRLIVLTAGLHSLSRTTEYFFFFFAMAFSVHICVNPFLYSAVDKKFRKDVINLFRRCLPWVRKRSSSISLARQSKASHSSSLTTGHNGKHSVSL